MHRTISGFLSPRERAALLVLARSTDFVAGRQGTGYEKRDLLDVNASARLVGRAIELLGRPEHFDAWLLRYPIGSGVPPHVDAAMAGFCHVRLNAIVMADGGGVFSLDAAPVTLLPGDAVLFRPDVQSHSVSTVEGHERLVFSVGANIPVPSAIALGLAH